MRRLFVSTIISLAVLTLLLFVLPRLIDWPSWPIAIVVVFGVMLIFMVRWHARRTGYECPHCMHRFAVSAWVDFLSPHTTGKLLRCPRCGESSWCREIERAMIPPESRNHTPRPSSNKSPARTLYLQIIIVFIAYSVIWMNAAKLLRSLQPDEPSGDIIKIPLATGFLVLLHLIFTGFAIRQRYRSAIYPIITLFVLAFLATALWTQYRLRPY